MYNNPIEDDVYVETKTRVRSAMSKQNKANGVTIIITIAVVVILALITLCAIYIPKFSNYFKAKSYMNDDKPEKAVKIYKDLGNFLDSKEMAKGGAYYKYADGLYDDRQYKDAAYYFDMSSKDSYKDSYERAKESYYAYGKVLMSSDNYEEAELAFSNAKDYEDAEDMKYECIYLQGRALYDQKEYDEAIKVLERAKGYEKADTLVQDSYYSNGEYYEGQAMYTEAYDAFLASGKSDSVTRASTCMYKQANNEYREGRYDLALEDYKKVSYDYRNCEPEIDKCYIAIGDTYYYSQDFDNAIVYYQQVTGTDMSSKITFAKLEYVRNNYKSSDRTTMEYLLDLKREGNAQATEYYRDLCGWSIRSFANGSETDTSTSKTSFYTNEDIYIHSSFAYDGEYTLDVRGQVVYGNGSSTELVAMGTVKNGSYTYFQIKPDATQFGEAIFYIFTSDGKLIEKYIFNIG